MPLRASPSRYQRLTQRTRSDSSAETNGSGVRGARPNSLAVITVAGAEIVSALSPLCPPVPDSRGIVMIGLSGPLVRDANTRVGCGCCKPLGAASDVKGKESTVRREACCLGDAVLSRTPNWVGRRFMFVTQ